MEKHELLLSEILIEEQFPKGFQRIEMYRYHYENGKKIAMIKEFSKIELYQNEARYGKLIKVYRSFNWED